MNWPAPENRGAKCSCMALHHTSGSNVRRIRIKVTGSQLWNIVDDCSSMDRCQMAATHLVYGKQSWRSSFIPKSIIHLKSSEGLRFSCHSWPQESRTGWQWLSSLSAKNGHTLKPSIEQGGLNRTALARNTYRIACALIICFYCAVHVTKTMKRRKNMIRLESAWAKPQSITSSHFVVPDAVLHLQLKIFRWSSLISHNFTAEILTSSEIKTYFMSAWYDIRNCFDDWLNFLNPGHVLHNKHNRRLKRIFFVFGCWLRQRWPVKKKLR